MEQVSTDKKPEAENRRSRGSHHHHKFLLSQPNIHELCGYELSKSHDNHKTDPGLCDPVGAIRKALTIAHVSLKLLILKFQLSVGEPQCFSVLGR